MAASTVTMVTRRTDPSSPLGIWITDSITGNDHLIEHDSFASDLVAPYAGESSSPHLCSNRTAGDASPAKALHERVPREVRLVRKDGNPTRPSRAVLTPGDAFATVAIGHHLIAN